MTARDSEALRGPAKLATALVVVTAALLVVGASVRVHGAGLACPDWPLCFGQVIPPIDFGVAFEFGHRVLAGLISLGFLGLLGWLAMVRHVAGRGIVALAIAAMVALGVQIVLGGLTVLHLLAEWTVASHLLVGNTFCAMLLLLAIALRERVSPVARPAVSPGARVFSAAMALIVPTQLVLGGLVSSSNAGLVCGTWPTCDGTHWIPTLQGLVGLQIVHRLVAYALLGVALVGAIALREQPRVGRAARILLGLGLLQGAIGVANVLLRLPVEITLAHTAGAASLFLCTTWLGWEAWKAPVTAAAPAPVGVGGTQEIA